MTSESTNRIDSKVMAKIKKCLRLAASDNPHEAATALRQAEALMRQHGVTSDYVELADVCEASTPGSQAYRLPAWNNYLIRVIADTYGVAPILRRPLLRATLVVFIGAGGAEAVACYAYEVLLRQVKRARSEYYKRLRGKRANRIARADHYAEGWVCGVGRMLADRKTAPPSIVDRYLAEHHPDLEPTQSIARKVRGRDRRDDQANGYIDGRDAQLHDGLGGLDQRRLTDGH